MPTLTTTYLIAFSAMTFSGLSALALIYAVSHLDSPDAHESPRESASKSASR